MDRVGRSGPIWALLAAIGMAYLVTGLALVLRALVIWPARDLETAITNRTLYFGGLSEPILTMLALSCGTVAAGAVARRAGGAIAVALYVALIALTGVLLLAHALENERLVRSAPDFYIVTLYDMPLTAVATVVPPALGLAIGALLARRRATDPRSNAALEATGAYAIVGALGLMMGLARYPHLLMAPYETIALGSLPHVGVVAAQIVVASIILALRARTTDVARAAAAFAAMALAGVAFAEVAELYGVIFFAHTYVPVSLVLVPLASAALGGVLVATVRSQFRSQAAGPLNGG